MFLDRRNDNRPRGLCGRCGPNSTCQGCVDPDMQSLMIDMGSGMMKVGFSGDDAPRVVYPTVYGEMKDVSNTNVGFYYSFAKDFYVGDEAYLRATNPKHLLERREVIDWESLEKVYHHTFYNELRVTPEEHPVLVTERPWTSDEDRERLTHIMFEGFNVPAYYVENQAALAIYTSGRTTGIVLDSGFGVTDAVPLYEGYPIQYASIGEDFGGKDVTDNLLSLLGENGAELMRSSKKKDIIDDIKERTCYLSEDFNKSEKQEPPKELKLQYELPDGSKLPLGRERYRAPEILFNPQKTKYGIHEMIHKSIKKCDEDIRKTLYQNIVLGGGNTMIEGIIERLSNEIQNLNPSEKIKVVAPAERLFSTWIGGSILSSLSTFQNCWITKDEYDDAGKTIVHRKCFGGKFGKKKTKPEPLQERFGDTKERIDFIIENYFCGESDSEVVLSFRIKINILNNSTIFYPYILII